MYAQNSTKCERAHLICPDLVIIHNFDLCTTFRISQTITQHFKSESKLDTHKCGTPHVMVLYGYLFSFPLLTLQHFNIILRTSVCVCVCVRECQECSQLSFSSSQCPVPCGCALYSNWPSIKYTRTTLLFIHVSAAIRRPSILGLCRNY